MRVYRLVNEPWIYGPRWWRARQVSKIAANRLAAEHVEWAFNLKGK